MSRLVSGAVVAAVWALASMSSVGWAEPREAKLLRGPMSERPILASDVPQCPSACPKHADCTACVQRMTSQCGGNAQAADLCRRNAGSDCIRDYCPQ